MNGFCSSSSVDEVDPEAILNIESRSLHNGSLDLGVYFLSLLSASSRVNDGMEVLFLVTGSSCSRSDLEESSLSALSSRTNRSFPAMKPSTPPDTCFGVCSDPRLCCCASWFPLQNESRRNKDANPCL